MTNQVAAERIEDIRDLRTQIADLSRQDQQEIVFKETSPPVRKLTWYSMVNGEPVQIPQTIALAVSEKRLPDGRYMFTARKENAPPYRKGTTRCFLADDSPERMSGVLDEIGLGGLPCPAKSLANNFSKRIHAQHRHPQSWAMYQEYIAEKQAEEDKAERREQLEATLAIAQAAGADKPERKRIK